MSEPPPTAELRVKELLERIGGPHASPGAGAAGAVALALAAACAAKAVTITLKHRPADSALDRALTTFNRISHQAMTDADRDAAAFQDFVRARTAGAAARLVAEGENFAQLIAALADALNEVDIMIDPAMQGDVLAARALMAAARSIQLRNEAEASRSR